MKSIPDIQEFIKANPILKGNAIGEYKMEVTHNAEGMGCTRIILPLWPQNRLVQASVFAFIRELLMWDDMREEEDVRIHTKKNKIVIFIDEKPIS